MWHAGGASVFAFGKSVTLITVDAPYQLPNHIQGFIHNFQLVGGK